MTEVLTKERYYIKLEMNDEVFECDTDDINAALVSLAPKVLKTRILLTITDNETGGTCQKQIFVRQGRMIFKNKVYRNVFVSDLIFKQDGI